MEFSLPDKYIKNESIYRTLQQNGDDGLIGAGFIHYSNNREHKEQLRFPKYGGLLLLRGFGKYWDDTGYECELTPGCFIHRFPDRVHCTEIVPDSQWVECYLVFGTPLFHALSSMGVLSTEHPVQHPGVNLHLIEKFDNLLNDIKSAPDTSLPDFIAQIIDLLIMINNFDKQSSLCPYAEIISEVTTALSANLEKKIEIKDLLKNHPISYDRFRFIFKQETGISPGIYRINKKMEKARELLTSKRYKVYQVAEMLGYPDAYSFSKQFSRFVGTSPKEYTRSI